MIEEVVRLRQQEQADDDNQRALLSEQRELNTAFESKPVANDIKSQTSVITAFTEQLNIERTGRQCSQGNEDQVRRPR